MPNPNQGGETTIADLPDECLRQIFLHVPMITIPGKSWISLRTVCKRWTPIIDDCWRETKQLVLCDRGDQLFLLRSSPEMLLAIMSNKSQNRRIACELIKRCGPFLKTLIEQRALPSTSSIMTSAAEECVQLEHFGGILRTKTDATQLRDLLDACKNFSCLKIHILAGRLYSFFQRIPTHQLTALSIFTSDSCDPHLPKYIKATIRHCRDLKSLHTDYMDDELAGLLTTLREIRLSNPGIGLSDRNGLLPLIRDELLVSLTVHCQRLETMSLECCIYVTDAGISSLSALPKLKVLNLYSLPRVTGKSLQTFSEIHDLNLVGCLAGDVEITGILRNCKILQSLNVAYTNITDKTLYVAVEETRKRMNNITLKIHCDYTRANPRRFQGSSPLLKIVGSNDRGGF
ncbi:uncharacterized protein LOC107038081 [Diachasma alloeum]|uniref:uncharacterized protein LOC107038081 n=1 Tax=Diachasma alloeum TaxID=454923 RepID=UPI00073810FA|nr:uncharacterized protein LOC107038081 [Diachasma alloeum]